MAHSETTILEQAYLVKNRLQKFSIVTGSNDEFIPKMDKHFDDSILIGSGFTVREALRPLAYSNLADRVQCVRKHLALSELTLAVRIFARNFDDDTLLIKIQTVSCKLMMNLVDCIRARSEQEGGNGRELLLRMLEVFVLKFHSISKNQMPAILKRCNPPAELSSQSSEMLPPSTTSAATPTSTSAVPTPTTPGPSSTASPRVAARGKGATTSEPEGKQSFSVADCRDLVKTLVRGVETIARSIGPRKSTGGGSPAPNTTPEHKQFQPKETRIFIKLVKYALQALHIYRVQVGVNGQTYLRAANCRTVCIKEEKEVLENFAEVFTVTNPLTFKEIFQTTVPYLVECIGKNYSLQIIANAFLANVSTSTLFATILVEFLVERLPEMGSNLESSNIYFKLFKLVFGSVSLFPVQNEQMLKPHLHRIVTSSMELAQGAQEPYNYFLLLRALFRTIGGGSHDLLYQEFLPLLPNLLQGLNMLQSGLHKQHMKDLLVELCLTVPVHLSCLLPYLSLLVDPIVSALNGSDTLVSQGLRTLELCVDNLQTDFLYNHIQPVRTELMQALYQTVRNPADNISHAAYRVLGKFGGSNRKMLKEAQKLRWRSTESDGPSVTMEFSDCNDCVQLPMEKAIEAALDCIKGASTEPFHLRQAWEVIHCFLVATMSLDEGEIPLHQLLSHPSFTEKPVTPVTIPHRFKARDTPGRGTVERALTGAFMSAVMKDVQRSALPFVFHLIRHYTIVAVAQQAGPFPLGAYQAGAQPSTAMFHSEQGGDRAMDPLVLVDAIAVCMSHVEIELCKIGKVALAVVFGTASTIMGSKERASQLPLLSYVAERLCACCYEQAWYAKQGGCLAIKFLLERLPLTWVLQHQLTFQKALLFVMADLTGKVSNGTVAIATATLEQLLFRCASPPREDERTPETVAAQKKAIHAATHELVREVTSPNSTVRNQAMRSLRQLACATTYSVAEIMEPHKEVLQDMIPPKKHVLEHQPANVQIGLMEGNTFCTTLRPRLFSMDLNNLEHKDFFSKLLRLCEAEDETLVNLPCYKNLPSLIPLRLAALNALASCNYLPEVREQVIAVLFKALDSTNDELQKAGEACMAKFLEETTIEINHVHKLMRPLLMLLKDYQTLTPNVLCRFASVIRLFPGSLNDKFCKKIMQHLCEWMEVVLIAHESGQCTDGSMKICASIINLLHQIPATPQTFVKLLLDAVMKIERVMLIEARSSFREALIKFLTRYPAQTVQLFMKDCALNDPQWSRMFMSFLKHSEAKSLRDVVAASPMRFFRLLSSNAVSVATPASLTQIQPFSLDLQYNVIKVISIIVKHDEKWLPGQAALVSQLRQVWISDAFQEGHRKEHIVTPYWKEPKLLASCLLNYCKHHYGQTELLFQLLRGLTTPFLCHLSFLKDYLEEELPRLYSAQLKRMLFFKFVEIFHDSSFPEELKAKALQHVLIPAFQHSLERGQVEVLLGPANPEGDSQESISSIFIGKVLELEGQGDMPDVLRIALLQFSALLVKHASHHIHDNNTSHKTKLERLMAFAWSWKLPKADVDPVCKYHGHLVLAHVTAKFAIQKQIMANVFISLLEAHVIEARPVVRQALAILTPAIPTRMEDGRQFLADCTKKFMVENRDRMPQLMHIIHFLVQHYRVYYPARYILVQHIVAAMHTLGFTHNASLEQRKLAIYLTDVILAWEVQREREVRAAVGVSPKEGRCSGCCSHVHGGVGGASGGDRILAGGGEAVMPGTSQSSRAIGGVEQAVVPNPAGPHRHQSSKPIDKQYTDTVINFLICIACQVKHQNPVLGSTGEMLSRRSLALLKIALKSSMGHGAVLKLQWLEEMLMTVEQGAQADLANVCTGLEVLSFLLTVLSPSAVLASLKPLQRGLIACMNSRDTKVLRAVQGILSRLMSSFPTEPSKSRVASKYVELENLYAAVGKLFYQGLTNYEKCASSSAAQLFGGLTTHKVARWRRTDDMASTRSRWMPRRFICQSHGG